VRPPTPRDEYNAVAASEMNRDAHDLLAAMRRLETQLDNFLDAHDAKGFPEAIRAAGVLRSHAKEGWGEMSEQLIEDVRGLSWVIEMTASIIEANTLPLPETMAGEGVSDAR
jgi:hypothetical protein